jgi:hypothetical protein
VRERRAAPFVVAFAVAVSTLLALLVRLVSLRALPIFGDEAIFLRLATLAEKDPLGRLWISLQESQPPLHVWLLALVLPLSPDPVLAGRILSVVAGVLCVPAAAWAARRTLDAFGSDPLDARIAAGATGALLALAPFFVFSERLARVDALFLLETILAAGLAVSIASASGARALRLGILFGLAMGLTMLSRQAVSYPLWGLPPIAWVLLPPPRRARAGPVLAALAAAAALGLLLWVPMLLAPGAPDAFTRIFHNADYRPAMSAAARIRMTLAAAWLAAEAFWRYLTPPVCVLAAIGAAGLATLASGRRLLAYLALWAALQFVPAAAFAASYFPRYALPAAVPLCVLAAVGAGRLWSLLAPRVRGTPARAALAGIFVLVLAPSVLDVARGERDWRDWRLLPIDRLQFLSGPPAGFASEAAAGALRRIAAERVGRTIAVLTPGISGNPTDAVWVLVGRDSRIRLSYTGDALARPLLPDADARGVRRLPGDARDPLARPETIAAGAPVYAVVPDPLLTRSGWVNAVPFLSRLNPRMSEVARFRNPEEPGSPVHGVVLLELPADR